jgi:NAD dependent epimerase/dehydratase family enzyme
VPAPLLRLALRRQAEVLLVGHRVEPKVALAHGYQYRYPSLAAALADSL